MTLASLLSCSLLCRVLSVHFTSLDPHPASDLNHVDLYSGISVGPLFHSARHWFTSCWHNLCLSLSLSRLQTDMLLASCCPLIMKPDEVSAFSIFISFTGILLCPLWTCWGREDLSEPFTDTFKLQCQTDWDLFTVLFYFLLTIAYRHFSTLRSLSPNSSRKFELLISSGPNQNTSPNSSIPIQ